MWLSCPLVKRGENTAGAGQQYHRVSGQECLLLSVEILRIEKRSMALKLTPCFRIFSLSLKNPFEFHRMDHTISQSTTKH